MTIIRKAVFFKKSDGSEPVKDWLDQMKRKKLFIEYSKIAMRIDRAAQGNFGKHRMLGGAFGELKIDHGPGYRVYFGIDGERLIVLLNGGSKVDQQEDINLAKARWDEYRKKILGGSNGK